PTTSTASPAPSATCMRPRSSGKIRAGACACADRSSRAARRRSSSIRPHPMKQFRINRRRVLASLATLVPAYALAQQPGRPITIIVPYSPGTGIDILARTIASDLSTRFGQPVVVDNRTGASGNIGTGIAARSAPDGNTLLMTAKVFVLNPSLFKSVPYDPVQSFDPIIKLATGSIVL